MTDSHSENENLRVYEVGCLWLPSVPEDKLPDETQKIEAEIRKAGGSPLSSGAPELMNLAYEMIKPLGTKNERYRTAYFGWMKFEGDSQAPVLLKKAVDANPHILRSLIVKAVPENESRAESERLILEEKKAKAAESSVEDETSAE
jgi:ribosomal protein S6